MTGIVNEVTVQLPIVLTDDEAAQIADKMLYKAWTERDQFEIRVSMQYAYLNAGDVIQIEADGNTHVMRIQSMDMSIPGVITIKGVADRASLYTSNAQGGSANYPTQTLQTYGNTIGPAWYDYVPDSEAGYYAGGNGNGGGNGGTSGGSPGFEILVLFIALGAFFLFLRKPKRR